MLCYVFMYRLECILLSVFQYYVNNKYQDCHQRLDSGELSTTTSTQHQQHQKHHQQQYQQQRQTVLYIFPIPCYHLLKLCCSLWSTSYLLMLCCVS